MIEHIQCKNGEMTKTAEKTKGPPMQVDVMLK